MTKTSTYAETQQKIGGGGGDGEVSRFLDVPNRIPKLQRRRRRGRRWSKRIVEYELESDAVN